MIHTSLVDPAGLFSSSLGPLLSSFRDRITIGAAPNNLSNPHTKVTFIRLEDLPYYFTDSSNDALRENFSLVCIGDKKEDAYEAMKLRADYFLLSPICRIRLSELLRRILEKAERKMTEISGRPTKAGITKIGIPTEGKIDYLAPEEIVMCTGQQTLTRVITTKGEDLLSSYNLGKFTSMLLPFGFFPSHKSYLVNLLHVNRLDKDRVIYLSNGNRAALSRRKRGSFMEQLPHIGH